MRLCIYIKSGISYSTYAYSLKTVRGDKKTIAQMQTLNMVVHILTGLFRRAIANQETNKKQPKGPVISGGW